MNPTATTSSWKGIKKGDKIKLNKENINCGIENLVVFDESL